MSHPIIDIGTSWPGIFGIFFLLGITVVVLGVWLFGREWDEEPLEWSLLIAIALGGALVGSKLYMLSAANWSDVAGGLGLPHSTGKNLLGGIAGGTVCALTARWFLGSRARAPDAWGLVLPVAILVGRFGCLLAGCCHGTVSQMPWSIRYPAGSHAFHHQVADGILQSAAAATMPIHPAQLYEMAGLVLLIPALWWGGRRMKRSGNTFLAMVAGYGFLRFVQEFARWGGDAPLGLKNVQWGLLVIVVAAATVIRHRECMLSGEHPRGHAATRGPRRLWLLAAVAAPLLAVAGLWFSPLERATLLLAVCPASGHLAQSAGTWLARRFGFKTRALPVSMSALLLASWTPLATQDRDKDGPKHSLRVEGAGGGGQVVYEDCDHEHYEDQKFTGNIDVAYRRHFNRRMFLEMGINSYAGHVSRNEGPQEGDEDLELEYHWFPVLKFEAATPYWLIGMEPYIGFDGYWWALYGGMHFFGVPEYNDVRVMGSAYIRAGPSDIAFIDYSFLHGGYHPMAFNSTLGLGLSLGKAGVHRVGWAMGQGMYVMPRFTIPVKGWTLLVTPQALFEFENGTDFFIGCSLGLIAPLD